MNRKKVLSILLAFILIGGGVTAYTFYARIKKGNVKNDTFIYIPSHSDFDKVVTILAPHLQNTGSFIWVAEKKNYPNKIKGGKYRITKNMNNEALVNMLRSGNSVPVKVTFNNQDTPEKLAGRIARQIEADSIELLKAFTDTAFLKQNGFDRQTLIAMYLPNSYEFYWNTDAETFRKRMLREFRRFWNKSRKEKAKNLGLTPMEVITLASIVQKETAQVSERPKVAGLYLNRLKKGWKLQADPTVIFAVKQEKGQDFTIKRVLSKDLETDSPYNTYMYEGLPPSPIGMPDISSVEAVLNPAQHDYFYMCASVDKPGFHEFSKKHSQHLKFARKYQRWISKQGINR